MRFKNLLLAIGLVLAMAIPASTEVWPTPCTQLNPVNCSRGTWGQEVRNFMDNFYDLLTAKATSFFDDVDTIHKYATFEAAVTALCPTGDTSPEKTLVIPVVTAVATNTTVCKPLTLEFTGAGRLDPATTIVVTVNGTFIAPLKQVIQCVGSENCLLFQAQRGPTVHPEWWGAVADYDDITGTDNLPFFEAAIASFGSTSRGGRVKLSNGSYFLNGTLHIRQSIILAGNGYYNVSDFFAGTGPSTLLVAPDNTTGIRVHSSLEAGETTTAGHVELKNFSIHAQTSTGTSGNGIHSSSVIKISRVGIRDFGGIGLEMNASVSGGTGNANVSYIEEVTAAFNGGDGFHAIGNDANVITFVNIDAHNNGGIGIHDESFLGNIYIGPHTASNVGVPYKTTLATAEHIFIGAYSEAGLSELVSPTVVIGGNLSNSSRLSSTSTALVISGAGIMPRGDLEFQKTTGTPSIYNRMGTQTGDTTLSFSEMGTISPVDFMNWEYDTGNETYMFKHNNSTSQIYFELPSNSTSPAPRVFAPLLREGFYLGSSFAAVDQTYYTSGSAAPVSGTWAVGDVVFNSLPATLESIGWVNTVAGTPGTWVEFGLISNRSDGVDNVLNYASFPAAITAIGSTVKTLIIPTVTASIVSNVTVPSTLTLSFTGSGQLNVGSVTLPTLLTAEYGNLSFTTTTIVRTSGSWITDGYNVADVTITITGSVPDLATLNAAEHTTIAFDSVLNTATRATGSWITDVYNVVGDGVVFTNTTSGLNDVTCEIVSTTATVLTLDGCNLVTQAALAAVTVNGRDNNQLCGVASATALVLTVDVGSCTLETEASGTAEAVNGQDPWTVTINGPVEAPIKQVFSGAGRVLFGTGFIFEMSPNHWGAKADASTDSSSAFQSAADSGVRRLILTGGQYRASNIKIDVAIQGITFVGHGRSETGVAATQISNNSTTPLITTKGAGSLNNFTLENISFTQTSSSQGHIFKPVNDYFNLQINNVYSILSSTTKSFFKSEGVFPALWTLRNVKVVMATGALVSALDIVSTTSQPTFGWRMERTQWDGDSTATAPAVKIHDGSSNTNAGGIIDGILFQNTFGGALELGSQQGVLISGMQVADVTGDPTQALLLIKKTGTQPSFNITIIGSDIQHTFTAVADLEVETASSQGGVTIISSTVKNIKAENQRPVIVSGLSSYNFMGTTTPVYIAHSGRLRGIAGISTTAVEPRNLKGTCTFATAATCTVSLSPNEADASYEIFVGSQANETFWITAKATTGFTFNSSNATSTAVASWFMVR
ncbi:MAG: hypothetical protein ABGX83_05255 [Nitrospira sp.]